MMVTEGQMYYLKMRITAERNIAHISSYKPDKTAAVSFYVVLWHKNLFFYSVSLSASNMPLGNNLIIYNS